MPHLYGHFDESGTYENHPIVSLSGLIGGFVRWQAFTEAWMRLLRQYELPALHAATALQPLNALGKMGKAASHEDRAAQIQPFVRSVIENLNGLAVAVTVDVEAYSKVKDLHADFSEDPHYFMFFMVINNVLTNPNVPKEHKIGLIFDDHQEKGRAMLQTAQKDKTTDS